MNEPDATSDDAPGDTGPGAGPPLTTPDIEAAGPATLRRSSTRRVFGGVCRGLGERFDIDPTIVRVVFVVLAALYGLGVVVYLAMWVLLPRSPSAIEDATTSDRSSVKRSRWLRILAPVSVLVLLVLFLAAVGHGHHGWSGVSLGGLRFDRGLIVLWLIFLFFLAVISLRSPQRAFSFGRFFGWLVLGVTTGLVVLVGAFLLLVQVIGVPLEGGSGAKEWAPTSLGQLQRAYHGAFGASTIDLTGVPFVAGTWSLTATQGVGTLIVDVPADVVVGLRTHVGIGDVQTRYVVVRPRAASHHGVTRLDLNLQVGIGTIELRRDVR
jgi:phage shock protein PspC (stress-responsive transcriptional regulator)